MNGHTPTRRQKDYLSHHGYLEDSWLVLKDTVSEMVIKNRKYPKRIETIRKDGEYEGN